MMLEALPMRYDLEMGKSIDLIGRQFGFLKVLGRAEPVRSCSGAQRLKWKCLCVCGQTTNVTTTNLTRTKHPTISCGCYRRHLSKSQPTGEASPSWKGGRRIEQGYVLVYMKTHPRAKKNGYVREHTVVMEKMLGRYLLPGENVHHINGDKLDNREENLELWSTSQPPGQRVQDKLKWAKEIIDLYG